MRLWIIYFLVQMSFFGKLLQSVLASVFFFSIRRRPTMVADIFTQSPVNTSNQTSDSTQNI